MHIILAVTNDITGDQRVMRTACTLCKMHADVTVISRRKNNLPDPSGCCYKTRRIRLLFQRGPFFYAEFNLRLFFFLLFSHANAFVSNDLDTLSAVYLAGKMKKKTILYDSHEFFTEVPELVNRPFTKGIWERIEALLLPRIRYASTVSEPIAAAYKKRYDIDMTVIRNLPFRKKVDLSTGYFLKKGDEKVILYQGSLNLGRGLELAIDAIQFTRNARLVIAGSGDLELELKQRAQKKGLQDLVVFLGKIDPASLLNYTVQADAGISLEEDLGLNYRYALPNKLFDYIQAGIPVLVSDLPEMKSVVETFNIGLVSDARTPEVLASFFMQVLYNEEKRALWKSNLEKAANELCWENEEKKLMALYKNAISDPAFQATGKKEQ